MKVGSVPGQKLMSILISAVLGFEVAMIIGDRFFALLAQTLTEQVLILSLLWFGFSTIFYLTIIWLSHRFRSINTLLMPELAFRDSVIKIFLAVFFLFPISLIFYEHVRELVRVVVYQRPFDWIGFTEPSGGVRSFFVGVLLLSSILLVLSSAVITRETPIKSFFDFLPDFYYIFFIFILGTSIRIACIYLIKTQPFSDLALINDDALLLSQGYQISNIYVPDQLLTTLIYGLVYTIFGPQLIVIKIFHILIYDLAGIFFYYLGKEAFQSKFLGLIAGILLVAWPSLAVYSNVLSPEHLFILVECILLFLLFRFFKNDEQDDHKIYQGPLKDLPRFAIFGFLFALLGMFRPFFSLFLVGFIITLLIYKGISRRIILNVLSLFLTLWLINKLPTLLIEKYSLRHFSDRTISFIPFSGLNFETYGAWSYDDVKLVQNIRSEVGNDKTELYRRIWDVVFERLDKNKDQLLHFVYQKFAILWANSNGILFWATVFLIEGDQHVAQDIARRVNLADFVLMFIISITYVTGTLIAFFKKQLPPFIFYCLISFFGFNLMEVLFEVQTRYRTVIMPLMILFTCWTFSTIWSSINAKHRLT